MITLAVIATQDGRKKKRDAGVLVVQRLAYSVSTECREKEFGNFKGLLNILNILNILK